MSPKSKEKVGIIIVTCGTRNYLKYCLDSVIKQTYAEFEVIVIDNSLNAHLRRNILEGYPDIRIYSQNKNISYCEALNLGIHISVGDFILCLNDDVILDTSFIEESLKGFFIAHKVGMVSGKILRMGGRTIDSTGLFLSFFRTARERGYNSKDRGQFDKEGYVFGVNGAVAFYRREMLEDIKQGEDYFDSHFRFFYEDLDLAWRAKRAGWKAYYMPSAIAYHVRGGTVRAGCGRNKPFARRFIDEKLHLDLIKNRYLTIIKNESYSDFLLHFLGILLYDLAMWAYILLFRPKLIKMFISNVKYLKMALKERGIARAN